MEMKFLLNGGIHEPSLKLGGDAYYYQQGKGYDIIGQ